jgi:protein TonB
MSELVGVRTTSLAASAGLVGAALVLAFTATIAQMVFNPLTSPPTVPMFVAPLEPPPPPAEAAPPEGEPLIVAPADASPLASLPAVEGDEGGLAAFSYGDDPADITNPRWLQRPRDLGAYYPRRARERGTEGQVVLDCLVTVEGLLNCRVASETPAGWGFGEAALQIARDHRMAPARQNGEPVIGRYRMVTPFRLH